MSERTFKIIVWVGAGLFCALCWTAMFKLTFSAVPEHSNSPAIEPLPTVVVTRRERVDCRIYSPTKSVSIRFRRNDGEWVSLDALLSIRTRC